MSVEVWTDGACFPNPGKGGWGWVTKEGQQNSGYEEKSTNQRMEMLAVIDAIQTLHRPGVLVRVFTDSMFVIDGSTKWMQGWKENGWVRKKGEVKNLDLWLMIDECLQHALVQFKWVKGHSGDEMNEKADALAGNATGFDISQRRKFERQFKWR